MIRRRFILFACLLLAVPAPGVLGASGGSGRAGRLLQKIDADGNGMISRAEAQASPELAAAFDIIDANHDGQITPDELRAWNRGRGSRGGTRKGKGGLDEQFTRADSNADGLLSRDEAGKSMPRVARYFDAIDANHDGGISREELRGYLQTRREAKGTASGVRKTP